MAWAPVQRSCAQLRAWNVPFWVRMTLWKRNIRLLVEVYTLVENNRFEHSSFFAYQPSGRETSQERAFGSSPADAEASLDDLATLRRPACLRPLTVNLAERRVGTVLGQRHVLERHGWTVVDLPEVPSTINFDGMVGISPRRVTADGAQDVFTTTYDEDVLEVVESASSKGEFVDDLAVSAGWSSAPGSEPVNGRDLMRSLHIELIVSVPGIVRRRQAGQAQYESPFGSVEDRTAACLIAWAIRYAGPAVRLVESASGDLGLALARGELLRLRPTLVRDASLSPERVDEVRGTGGKVVVVAEARPEMIFQETRTAIAGELGGDEGCVWLNQSSNPAGMQAYEEATDPELLDGCRGAVDTVVVSVGTGGTICDICAALRDLPHATQGKS